MVYCWLLTLRPLIKLQSIIDTWPGTTVDVILVNGKLRNGDVVVMPGTEGPIVSHIRELLMPEPMKELRVKVLLYLMSIY